MPVHEDFGVSATKGGGIVTTSLVDVGSKLPVVVHFVEKVEKVDEVMPTLRRMAGKRLITVQEIQVVPAEPLI
jgi:PII-like signaling protein